MFGNVFLLGPRLGCDELIGFEGGVSSTSEGDVLHRRLGLPSDGMLEKGSKRMGGGDESGDELGGTPTSAKWS